MMINKQEFCIRISSYCSQEGTIIFGQNLNKIYGSYHHLKNHIQTTNVWIISEQ